MSAGTLSPPGTIVHRLGKSLLNFVAGFGDLAIFALRMLACLFVRSSERSTAFQCMYRIGVLSVPVVMVTGAFIGMVLAVQAYDQFRLMHLETRLGAVINISLVKELGPVMAAIMLSGRVGSAIAAELGTMRVTEQIDALRALGANPIRYLVVPRFLACVLMIPLLTAVADLVGSAGGWFFSTQVLGINGYHYWHHAVRYVTAYDVLCGLFKSVFFGGAIAVVACHRGFHCGAGAEGVGRAATEAFVYSFVAILGIDFVLGVLVNNLYYTLWDDATRLM